MASAAPGRLRLDRLGVLAPADLHAARLGRLGDRDRERQHAVLIVGLHVLGVQRVAEEELATVGPVRALGHEHLIALSRLEAPLGPHAQDVLLDGQIDRRGLDAREVELDDELVAAAVGVHREPPRDARRGGRELLGEPVELAKWIEADEHVGSFVVWRMGSLRWRSGRAAGDLRARCEGHPLVDPAR
jgi:hypothetical protein